MSSCIAFAKSSNNSFGLIKWIRHFSAKHGNQGIVSCSVKGQVCCKALNTDSMVEKHICVEQAIPNKQGEVYNVVSTWTRQDVVLELGFRGSALILVEDHLVCSCEENWKSMDGAGKAFSHVDFNFWCNLQSWRARYLWKNKLTISQNAIPAVTLAKAFWQLFINGSDMFIIYFALLSLNKEL